MKKRVSRREFLRLASIWGVVPFLSKFLTVTDEVDDDEEVSDDNLSPWLNGHCCPYYWNGTHAACEDPDCWCLVDNLYYTEFTPCGDPVTVWIPAEVKETRARFDAFATWLHGEDETQ